MAENKFSCNPSAGRDTVCIEANRILEEHNVHTEQKRRRPLPRGVLFFLLGILCGVAAAVLIGLWI